MRRVPKKQLAVKPVVSSEFDECTRSENFIEILRFRHLARYMSFTPTGKQGKKKQIMNGIEVSVVLHFRLLLIFTQS